MTTVESTFQEELSQLIKKHLDARDPGEIADELGVQLEYVLSKVDDPPPAECVPTEP